MPPCHQVHTWAVQNAINWLFSESGNLSEIVYKVGKSLDLTQILVFNLQPQKVVRSVTILI